MWLLLFPPPLLFAGLRLLGMPRLPEAGLPVGVDRPCLDDEATGPLEEGLLPPPPPPPPPPPLFSARRCGIGLLAAEPLGLEGLPLPLLLAVAVRRRLLTVGCR